MRAPDGSIPLVRLVGITFGLAALGAILGAFAGIMVLFFVTILLYGDITELEILAVGALVGIVLGTPALPLAWWLLLRRVPLRRSAPLLVIGTVVGGVSGWMITTGIARLNQALLMGIDSPLYPCVVGAALGFVLGALRARSTE